MLNALSWDVDLHLVKFAPALFAPEVPGTVSGKLHATGMLDSLNATAQISMRDETESALNWDGDLDIDLNLQSLLLKVKRCKLKHLDSDAALQLSGTAAMEQQLDLLLNWQNLQWPFTGDAAYSSPSGTVTLTGNINDFHLTLQGSTSGSAIPAGTIRLSSDGNTESANNIDLTVNTLDGNIKVLGSVEWAPIVKWQVETTAAQVNPGLQYPDWPGSLNWHIKSNGQIEEAGVLTDVTIESLQGTLRDRPVAGSGDIAVSPESIQINKFLLSSGEAKLDAEGTLGEVSDLKWNIRVADFADLLPEISGQLAASGTVSGKMMSPEITADISGSNIVVPQAELENVHLEADMDLSWREPFVIDLEVNNLTAAENVVPKITLQSNGTITDHSLKLYASHELAELTLALQGGYKDDQWNGALRKLSLKSRDMGTWQSSKESQVTASAEKASLESLCLTREQSDLCISGTWDKENKNTGGKASLTGFPLNWLAAWFPETLDDLGGVFSLNAEASMKDKLQATAHAQITPGEISYTTLKDKGILAHEGLKLNLEISDDGLDTDLWLSVDSNVISGNLHSPDLLRADTDHSPEIKGKIKIDAGNFALVETLVEDVQNLDARLDTDLTLSGTLKQPEINGKGKLHINNILIPAAGLELSDTSLNILANNSKVKLDGVFNSGKGFLAIEGKALLNAEENFPAFVTIKADNFRLVNLPEIQVYLASDLQIEKKKDLTLLSGTVTIPKADILLRDLPKGTKTASPDIVIVQEQKEEETTSPMQMNLKVVIGRKVHFTGFGLNAFIDGQLSITAEPEEQLLGSGEFHIRQGSYRAYGQDLQIEKGVISFPGGPLTQPGINMRASRSIGDVVAGISAIGPAATPRITTYSRPPMSESQILSYIITGSSPSTGGAKLSIGRQINNTLSVSVGTDTKTGESEFVARYRLNRKIHVETSTGSSSNAADIFYTTELGGKKE